MIDYLKNKYTAHKKRGFTLIELIVVMSVVAVLVLLAVPKFLGQTDKAIRTKHIANASQVQKAAERYYVDEGDWPRLTDDPYTSEQIADYSDRIFDLTGEPVELDPDGNYYNIDYDKLDKYVKVDNADKNRYILQNPIGKVFYLENLSTEGETRVDYGVVPEESDNEEEPVYSNEEIEGLIDINYIPVATADELNSIRDGEERIYGEGTDWEGEYIGGLDKHYVQVADIDLSEYSDSEEGWNPIGVYVNYANIPSFKGTYDGGNHVITGLEVKGEGKAYQGLFGYAQGATIRNVGLVGNEVTGAQYVGGLVGYAIHSSNISNSYATGSVTGERSVGGLVGHASGNISNSYTTGPVTGSERVGGLVGQATYQTDINNSYAKGNVSGGSHVGGLVGMAHTTTEISNSYATGEVTGSGNNIGGLVGETSDRSNIINSYATGPVTGENNIGGLVGSAGVGPWVTGGAAIENSYATGSVEGSGIVDSLGNVVGGLVGDAYNITIENSYATGLVKGGNNVGGLVGSAGNSTISNSYVTGPVTGMVRVGGIVGLAGTTTIENSYWDTVTTGQEEPVEGGTGLTTDEMKNQATYSGWDFINIWEITPGNYPTLR